MCTGLSAGSAAGGRDAAVACYNFRFSRLSRGGDRNGRHRYNRMRSGSGFLYDV